PAVQSADTDRQNTDRPVGESLPASGSDHEVLAAERAEVIMTVGKVPVMQVGRGHDLHVAESGLTRKADRLIGRQQAQPGMSGCSSPLSGALQDLTNLRRCHLDRA